jgi:hypothetical protein
MPGLTRASSSHIAPIPDSLDQVTDGTTVNTIIKLFFDYVRPPAHPLLDIAAADI